MSKSRKSCNESLGEGKRNLIRKDSGRIAGRVEAPMEEGRTGEGLMAATPAEERVPQAFDPMKRLHPQI
jgi:hypothetical protein